MVRKQYFFSAYLLSQSRALMLNGSARIQAVNENGEAFIDDVSKGDVWFFPA
jgi:hypothetical protein